MSDLCEFCGAPATYLCDFAFGVDNAAEEPDRMQTCDAALCDSCKTTVSNWHLHGEVNGEHCGGFDSVDYCAAHVHEQPSLLPCTAKRAEEMRAANRLRRMLRVDGLPVDLANAVGQVATQLEQVASELRELHRAALRGEVAEEDILALVEKATELFRLKNRARNQGRLNESINFANNENLAPTDANAAN